MLTLIISPALRGVGRYQAYLDGDDLVLCVSRMPFLAPFLVATQLDVAETPFGPKFIRHRRPIEGCVDCNGSTVRAFSGSEFMRDPVGAVTHEDDLPQA
jgi:hypothetical protein